MCCYYTECETQSACRRGYVNMHIYNGQNSNSNGSNCGCQNNCQGNCGCNSCSGCSN